MLLVALLGLTGCLDDAVRDALDRGAIRCDHGAQGAVCPDGYRCRATTEVPEGVCVYCDPAAGRCELGVESPRHDLSVSGDLQWRVVQSDARVDNVPDPMGVCCFELLLTERGGTSSTFSVAFDGARSNGNSAQPSISADGRLVAFQSSAANLVEGLDLASGDFGVLPQVFVRDRESGETRLLSAAWDGAAANGPSMRPSISADGRYVAFWSAATNLIDNQGSGGLYLYDRELAKLAFYPPTELPETNFYDFLNWNAPFNLQLAGDGSAVVIDTGEEDDTSSSPPVPGFHTVFLFDLGSGEIRAITVGSDGWPADDWSDSAVISDDGRRVAFRSFATNLVDSDGNGHIADVFVYDRDQESIRVVSVSSGGEPGDGDSGSPSISADGRYVAFQSKASNLAELDANGSSSDVFLHDLDTGTTSLVSIDWRGQHPAEGWSATPRISSDDRYVFFESATRVPADDGSGYLTLAGDQLWGVANDDFFVYDRETGTASR